MRQGLHTFRRFGGFVRRFWPAVVFSLLWTLMLAGCGEEKTDVPKSYVLQCGSTVVTEAEFADELDLKLSAYPFNLKNSSQEYNAVVLDLIAVLSDEIMLLEAAKDKGITVNNEEISQAEAAVREDYPEDSFEQMLLENAITYKVWKKKLEKDMVIDKYVRAELIRAQEITPDDVMAFYRQHARPESTEPSQTLDEQGLIRQLRLEKSQASYEDWISALKAKYPVEIDKKAVSAFLEKTK